MDTETYAQAVLAAYRGEVGGEALFSRLLETASTAELQHALACMLQLESATKMSLRPLLGRLGLSLVEPASDRAAGRAWAERLLSSASDGWPGVLAGEVEDYMARYDALGDVAAPGDREVLSFLAAHERALHQCLLRLDSAPVSEACAAVIALLQQPLPPLTS
jgi:hypothetical protein